MKRIWLILLCVSPLLSCGGSSTPSQPPPPPPPSNAAWWQAGASGRYLVDQNGTARLMVGDSPHSMFVNLNSADLSTYLANRQSHGFNVLWVEGLCSDYIGNCRADLSTYDGIKPFTSGTDEGSFDISTPNEAYWSRVDSYVNAAASYHITILFDTWETGALISLARASGNDKMRAFGAYLGNRYKDFPNIIWIMGNDFQTWTDDRDNQLMQNLMAGIASADPNHLQTTELSYYRSGSLDDTLLVPYTSLTGVYDYYCAYTEAYAQYNHSPAVPVFFEEGYYEFRGSPRYLRTQAWWVALSGANAGQMYGSENIYKFEPGWQSYLDTVPVAEFGYLNGLLKTNKWYDLVPDQSHVIVTAGYGTQDGSESFDCIDVNDYVTTASLPDGSGSISYVPHGGTLTVDLSKFKRAVTAKWFDPTSGQSTTISGSPFPNSGSRDFAVPANNSSGDQDWVLQLTAQ